MAFSSKHILTRLYLVAGGLFVFGGLVLFKLVSIQMVQGDKYKELALQLLIAVELIQ